MTLTVNSLGDNPQQPGITADAYIPDQLIAGPLQLVTDSITLTGAAVLQRGSVLGKVTLGTGTAAAKAGGNTGNGTITMDATTPVLANALAGVYTARCINTANGTVAAAGTATAAAGNTGAGTITAAPATGAGAQVGTYSAECIAASAGGGTFSISSPDGKVIGKAVVGTPFTTQLTFTIAASGADFVVGDAFNVVVAAGEQNETFRVTDPRGEVLGDVTITGAGGTGAFANQVKFVLTDGTTDWVVGDGFDITVAAGVGSYKLAASAALDGSAVPAAILVDYSDATGGDVVAPIYLAGEFNGAALTLGSGITLAAAKAALRPIGIHIKTSVSAADPT